MEVITMKRSKLLKVILTISSIAMLIATTTAAAFLLLPPQATEAASLSCVEKAMKEIQGANEGLFDVMLGADPQVQMGVFYGQIWARNGHAKGLESIYLSRVDEEPDPGKWAGYWWLNATGWASWNSTMFPVQAVCVYSIYQETTAQKTKLYAWLYDPLADVPNLNW
jgi:hypothetical protein